MTHKHTRKITRPAGTISEIARTSTDFISGMMTSMLQLPILATGIVMDIPLIALRPARKEKLVTHHHKTHRYHPKHAHHAKAA